MDKVLVCLTGVVNRSIKYTWPSIEDNLVKPLKTMYAVDIAVFNNNVGECRVDGKILNNGDLSIIPSDYLFEYKQSDLDKEIKSVPGAEIEYPPYFSGKNRQNGLRHMCIERKVARFLGESQDNYKYVLVTNADYFYVNPLPLSIFASIDGKTVATCHHLDCRGYTDGFYLGTHKALCTIMGRISHYHGLMSPLYGGDQL